MNINRTMCALLCAGALSCAATESIAAVVVQGVCQGRLNRGTTTIGDNFSGAVALPDDGTTGLFDIANSHLFGAGKANSHLSSNAISSVAGSIGASNLPDEGQSFQALGSGDTTYQDELVITSASLPVGTPITIQFSYQVAHVIFGESSLGLGAGSNNRALLQASISGQMRSLGQTGDIQTIALLANDHNAFIDTGSSTNVAKGLFSGTQHLDVFVNAEIGGTIIFNVRTDADAISNMSPVNNANQTASATCQIGFAYGATGLTINRGANDIVITSTRTGLPFPAASLANANAAAAVMPESVLPQTCCPGNADGAAPVNFADITAILSNWLNVTTPGAQEPGDANCDGIVNFADITDVLANWLDPC